MYPELRGIDPSTKDVPADWEPDCENCKWFAERYEREDMYLFQSLLDRQWHVNNSYGKKMRKVTFNPATSDCVEPDAVCEDCTEERYKHRDGGMVYGLVCPRDIKE